MPSAPFFDDFRNAARQRLDPSVFDYIDSAAGEERTAARNEADLAAITFRPLCLRDVGHMTLTATLLGQQFDAPIGFSPTAFHRLVHPEGEMATALAARALNLPMIVSSMSSVPLDEIARSSGHSGLWFQTYLFRDRAVTLDLVLRAKAAGYGAIVLTVGCPVPGLRDRNIRNRFVLPHDVTAANFASTGTVVHNNPIHSFQDADPSPCATWHDVEWLHTQVDLPILLKGLMNPADVEPAITAGAAGIIVSNHGGRQLDGTASAIAALPDIASRVEGRLPIFIDSGFRRGTDITKALALGADAVFLGRPILWALAVGGKDGLTAAFEHLIDELSVTMRILGCRSIDELRQNASRLLYSPALHY